MVAYLPQPYPDPKSVLFRAKRNRQNRVPRLIAWLLNQCDFRKRNGQIQVLAFSTDHFEIGIRTGSVARMHERDVRRLKLAFRIFQDQPTQLMKCLDAFHSRKVNATAFFMRCPEVQLDSFTSQLLNMRLDSAPGQNLIITTQGHMSCNQIRLYRVELPPQSVNSTCNWRRNKQSDLTSQQNLCKKRGDRMTVEPWLIEVSRS